MAKHKPETVVKASIQLITRLERQNAELRKAAEAVIDEFAGAEDGEYPSVENLLRVLNL